MLLDPRLVANLIVAEAERQGRPTTNLRLQKILYFVHGKYLARHNVPLMQGYLEAWQYGPVHPLVYDSFKHLGAAPIRERARKHDLLSGREVPVGEIGDSDLREDILDLAVPYLKLSPGRLVDLSHARNSPWDVLTRTASDGRCFGFRITEDLIRSHFRHHKITIQTEPRIGEPNEESPPY